MEPEGLKRQFELTWDMLEQALAECPDTVWRKETPPDYSIAKLTFHIIQSTQRYCRTGHKRVELDPFDFGGREQDVPAADFPSLPEVRAYSDKVRTRVMKWLDSFDEKGLSDWDNAFQWTGGSIGERAVYTLKHFNHHLGQINLLLRLNGRKAAEWKCG